MSGKYEKSKKLTWLNLTIVALLLVVVGFTLSACQQLMGGKSPEQLDNQPAQSDQKPPDPQLQNKQPAKPDQQSQDKSPAKVDQKQADSQKNSSTQSQKNSGQQQDKVQDTQADDDPD